MLKSSAGDNYTLNSVHDTVDKLAALHKSASQQTHTHTTDTRDVIIILLQFCIMGSGEQSLSFDLRFGRRA